MLSYPPPNPSLSRVYNMIGELAAQAGRQPTDAQPALVNAIERLCEEARIHLRQDLDESRDARVP